MEGCSCYTLAQFGKKPSKDPLSYRSISLISCVTRVLEKALNMQIRKYLEVNKLIYDHRSGFLPQYSTVTQLYYLNHKCTMALDRKQCIQAVFLDLSKAYNRVPTAALLLSSPAACGFSPQSAALKWMESFLANHRERVIESEICTPSQLSMQAFMRNPSGYCSGTNSFLCSDFSNLANLVGKPSIFTDDPTVFFHGNNRLETCQALSKTWILPRIGL